MPKEKQEEIAVKLGTVTCEGHRLSTHNMIFLFCQDQGAHPLAMVGGFRQWKKAGRQVQKGEHAAGYIYVPLGVKKDGEETDGVRFRLVPVFDVTQTEEIETRETVPA